MRLKRLVWWAVIAFAIFFLLTAPAQAALLVKGAGETASNLLLGAADALSAFIKTLV